MYWNGAGRIEVAQRIEEAFSLFRDDAPADYIGLEEMRAKLREIRDRAVADLRPMLWNSRVQDVRTDEVMRAVIHEDPLALPRPYDW